MTLDPQRNEIGRSAGEKDFHFAWLHPCAHGCNRTTSLRIILLVGGVQREAMAASVSSARGQMRCRRHQIYVAPGADGRLRVNSKSATTPSVAGTHAMNRRIPTMHCIRWRSRIPKSNRCTATGSIKKIKACRMRAMQCSARNANFACGRTGARRSWRFSIRRFKQLYSQ